MFSSQPMRSLFIQQQQQLQQQKQLAMMAQFQNMSQNKNRDALLMNAYLSNLQNMNQAHLLNQQNYPKDLNPVQAKVFSEAETGSKSHSSYSNEVSPVEKLASLNAKRRLDLKQDNESEEVIQKKLREAYNIAHTTSTSNGVVPTKALQTIPKVQKNYLRSTKMAKKKVTGSFETGDQVLKIMAFKFDKDANNMMYLVEWKSRNDGLKPENSYIDRVKLLEKDPASVAIYFENQIFNSRSSFCL